MPIRFWINIEKKRNSVSMAKKMDRHHSRATVPLDPDG